jgi:hypothetical protein
MNRIWYQLAACILACGAYFSVSVSLAQETSSDDMNTPADAATSKKESPKKETLEEDSTNQDNVSGDSDTVLDPSAKDDANVAKQPKADEIIQKIKTSVLKVTVFQLGDDNLPIKDARVIVTLENAKELEYKTDDSGVALLTGLPYGKVDIDVTSSGRQSGGGTVTLDEPQETLTFHLKPRSFGNH